jgi:hypothetical protein
MVNLLEPDGFGTQIFTRRRTVGGRYSGLTRPVVDQDVNRAAVTTFMAGLVALVTIALALNGHAIQHGRPCHA